MFSVSQPNTFLALSIPFFGGVYFGMSFYVAFCSMTCLKLTVYSVKKCRMQGLKNKSVSSDTLTDAKAELACLYRDLFIPFYHLVSTTCARVE